MRSTFAALFCSALVTFPAAAVRAQPAGTAEASAPTHDGFYLRLSLGGGALRAKFRDASGVDPIATVHGIGYKAS